MNYHIDFIPDVDKAITKYKKSNTQLFKKLVKLLEDISLHPKTGIGHPEPLIGGEGITYSRHITAHDRIIYNIYDDEVTVLVIEIGGHYRDK